MDLGCLDLGCIEKQISQSSGDSDLNPNDSLPSTSKTSKGKIQNKASKEANQPSPLALNRLASQIKKPPRRKTSPLSWFPRKKVDSYLERKLKLLQEVDGMNSTLDETLGDTNPHFSKVLREKIAVKEAAQKAIEARKAALVEASWCRILKAARIESKEAEAIWVKAEKSAAEAFESAKDIGVIMYDIPDCPRKHCKIETSAVNGGESTTHTVTTTFDTAFEVDKQVAAAVKAAFVRLSSCPSIGKEEFKQVLRRISQNPDLDESYQDACESSSECESGSHRNEMELGKEKQRESLVEMMLLRLRCLQEEELASLATIVATCGLNAALAEAEDDFQSARASFKEEKTRKTNVDGEESKKQQVHEELPGLDKFLVKRLTRLEREIQDARNARIKEKIHISGEKVSTELDGVLEKQIQNVGDKDNKVSKDGDLGSMLRKHTWKLEKEIEESKRKFGSEYEPKSKRCERSKQEIPGLGEVLVKRVSQLEMEVQEAKKEKENVVEKEIEESKRKVGNEYEPKSKRCERSKQEIPGLGEVMVKRVSRLEREVQEAKEKGNVVEKEIEESKRKPGSEYEPKSKRCERSKQEIPGLGEVLVKRVSRLEREVQEAKKEKENVETNKQKRAGVKEKETDPWNSGSLDSILVKQVSRLEKEKMGRKEESEKEEMKNPVVAKREAREREQQEAWGGMSFGNSIRPHLSRLQKDKAAWLKAENEEAKGGLR